MELYIDESDGSTCFVTLVREGELELSVDWSSITQSPRILLQEALGKMKAPEREPDSHWTQFKYVIGQEGHDTLLCEWYELSDKEDLINEELYRIVEKRSLDSRTGQQLRQLSKELSRDPDSAEIVKHILGIMLGLI